MDSIEEWRQWRKESDNLKTEQQKVSNMNEKKQTKRKTHREGPVEVQKIV